MLVSVIQQRESAININLSPLLPVPAIPALWVITEHWAEFPGTAGCHSLASLHTVVYIRQFYSLTLSCPSAFCMSVLYVLSAHSFLALSRGYSTADSHLQTNGLWRNPRRMLHTHGDTWVPASWSSWGQNKSPGAIALTWQNTSLLLQSCFLVTVGKQIR